MTGNETPQEQAQRQLKALRPWARNRPIVAMSASPAFLLQAFRHPVRAARNWCKEFQDVWSTVTPRRLSP